MGIAQFIQEYGYWAVALGSFLEGEAVLLSGSFAASQGHLELALVLPISILASFLGDLPYFFAGRRYGSSVLQRFPSLQCRKHRVEHLLHKYHLLLVPLLRFMYGLRIPGLISLGMSQLSTVRFLCLNFVGAVIWGSSICAIGYGAGRLIRQVSGELGTVEQISMLVVIILCASMLTMLLRRQQVLAPTSSRGRQDKH